MWAVECFSSQELHQLVCEKQRLNQKKAGFGKCPKARLLSLVLTENSLNLTDCTVPGTQQMVHKRVEQISCSCHQINGQHGPSLRSPQSGQSSFISSGLFLTRAHHCVLCDFSSPSAAPLKHWSRRARTMVFVHQPTVSPQHSP